MRSKFFISIFLFLILCTCYMISPNTIAMSGVSDKTPRLGIWITVFSPNGILFSTDNADKLIDTCKKTGIQDIYLQIYRANKVYYDSDLVNKEAYDKMLTKTKKDPIKYLLGKAKSEEIKVHAWINALSIAQNQEADILKEYGDGIITKDQHGRSSFPAGKKDELDNYYIRENQIFLEPGDYRVRGYLTDMVKEIMQKYPGFSGLHLDYIRYPAIVPFTPGSRFTSHGISYGYNEMNIKNFEADTGLDVRTMPHTRENFYKWDDWRRGQVTKIVKYLSVAAREIHPDIIVSCAIVPSIERTYLITFQDWTRWLDEGYVDYVVSMDYTDDTDLMELYASSLMSVGPKGKIHIGLGTYLLKDDINKIKDQLTVSKDLDPAGIVIFSYDDIADNAEVQEFLTEMFKAQSGESEL